MDVFYNNACISIQYWRAYMLHDLKSQGFLRSIELIIIGISRKYNGVFCKNLGTNRAFAFQEFMRNPDVA